MGCVYRLPGRAATWFRRNRDCAVNEDVHVQEGTHHYASPARSLSTSSLVTTFPRFGKGRMPWCDCARALALLRGSAVRAAPASSEITSPVLLFSRRARSLAAART